MSSNWERGAVAAFKRKQMVSCNLSVDPPLASWAHIPSLISIRCWVSRPMRPSPASEMPPFNPCRGTPVIPTSRTLALEFQTKYIFACAELYSIIRRYIYIRKMKSTWQIKKSLPANADYYYIFQYMHNRLWNFNITSSPLFVLFEEKIIGACCVSALGILYIHNTYIVFYILYAVAWLGSSQRVLYANFKSESGSK